MSPSGSVSLSSTGRMVVFPARTPKVSGLATGALLGLVRSGRTVCWTSSAESLSASSEVCLRRDDVVPVVDQLHVLVHQPHIPGVHIIQDHQVPVHPEHIRRRRTRLGHVHVLVIGIIRAVADILVRPRPRRMDTPAQLHRRRRNTLTVKRDSLRRGTIQRLLQQRLRRRHGHRIRRPDRDCCSFASRASARCQRSPARQEQLPPARIQHHRLVPHHRQLQITRTLQPIPGAGLGWTWPHRSASTVVTVTAPDFGSAL